MQTNSAKVSQCPLQRYAIYGAYICVGSSIDGTLQTTRIDILRNPSNKKNNQNAHQEN